MTKLDDAPNGAHAVQRFRALVGPRAPDRIQARLDGRDGMAGLCEVEAALCDAWPSRTAKELVWLTCSHGPDDGAWLQLRAFARDGAMLAEASFRLGRCDV